VEDYGEEPPLNPIFAEMPTTIFDVVSGLAREHGAVNLGQGFPEGDGPQDIRAKAAEATMAGPNQYPPMRGLPELRAAVAEHYRRFQNLDLSTEEVVVTSGATEALAASLLALISPGDEVVLIQPMYDAYLPLVRLAGGVPRFVSLKPPAWRLTEAALAEAFGARTKVVVFNDPLNPAARAFDADEIALLAQYCRRFDAVAVCDEVWEHVLFDGRAHHPLIAQPGMRERAVKIGSAGKIFSMTGWKVGFACAAPRLIEPIAKAHQFLTFTTPPNLQAAVAYGLAKPATHFSAMRADFQRSRDRLAAGLKEAGFVALQSEGAYFLSIDLAASGVAVDDQTFCRRAIVEAGVAAIPVSAFYAEDAVTHVARLCFAKSDATLDAGVERLARARLLMRGP
jgi:aspartate/methionine/tyrosine aminotransferase